MSINKKIFPKGDLRVNFRLYAADQDLQVVDLKNVKADLFLKLWPEIKRKLE